MRINIARRSCDIKKSQAGFTHNNLIIVLALVFGLISAMRLISSHAVAAGPRIVSGESSYCLDNKNNKNLVDNPIDLWKCNDSSAQVWSISGENITHDDKYCLSVQNNDTVTSSKIVLNYCNNAPGQIWLRDKSGFYNPNSKMCLSAPKNNDIGQLSVESCGILSSRQGVWLPSSSEGLITGSVSCNGSEGQKVACNAVREWSNWQSNGSNHEILLTNYTDGAPFEEWCADFVSYIYKEAGFPFTQGETNGWDESNANNLQNMNFTKHLANSGYIPKTGDIAYFDYLDGHVEIVVSGGPHPTFIYGNSATIDPTTGNGQMMANTITKDGGEGQLIYYLSPN